MSGRSLREIEVKEHTVSELLRLYLIKQNDQFSKRVRQCFQFMYVNIVQNTDLIFSSMCLLVS